MKHNRTIPEIMLKAASQWPDQIAVSEENTTLTFDELSNRAKRASGALIASGLQTGDRFSIWAPNIHEWIWVALGGLMAGGVLVPLNTRYRGLEAGDILRRSQARFLFTTNGFLETDYPAMLEAESLPDLDEILLLRGNKPGHPSLDEFLARSTEQDEAESLSRTAVIKSDHASDILYTSGTTGAPKGVVSSHAQTVAIFDCWSSTVGLQHGDHYLIVNPFFHSFGYKAGWLSCLIKGATAFPMSVYAPDETLALIEQQKITFPTRRADHIPNIDEK